MATLLQLRTLFRQYVDDENSERITNAEANVFINLGQSFVQQVIVDNDEWFFASCQSYSVVSEADSYEFTLPSDFLVAILCERLRPGNRPIPANFVDFRQRHKETRSQGIYLDAELAQTPSVYLRGNNLGVVAPTSSYTMVLWYVKRLADLSSDGAVSSIPLEHHNLMALHAAKLSKGEETVWPQALEELYQLAIDRVRIFTEGRQRQQSRSVNYIQDL
jgi:hypothetical protein